MTPLPSTVTDPLIPTFTRFDTQVAEAFRGLPDGDRALLLLVAWDDCTIEELAAYLGCNPNAAKTRLFRARQRFRLAVDPLHR